MKPRDKSMFCLASTVLWIGGLVNQTSPLTAAGKPASPARDNVPRLTVRVYAFPGLSSSLLAVAEVEAARLLRGVPIDWLNCTAPRACSSPESPADLTVRILPKALPSATSSALGMASWSGDRGGAFIFYDRAIALRTASRLLPHILGRVMAHEITHLLLGWDSHSDVGLMRGQWTADDLRFDSLACLGLTALSAARTSR